MHSKKINQIKCNAKHPAMNTSDQYCSLHPLVATVLAQKEVRCNRFYEEAHQTNSNEASENKEPLGEENNDNNVAEVQPRSFFGLQTDDDEHLSKPSSTESEHATTIAISAMQRLKEAYEAYKYVNQVRSNGTYIGMVGSAGLLALKAVSALYGTIFRDSDSTQLSRLSVTKSFDGFYWFALGAAIGVAVHAEVRWLLSDQSIAKQHLSESQRFALMIANSGADGSSSNIGQQESHERLHKHRRRKRRREQQ